MTDHEESGVGFPRPTKLYATRTFVLRFALVLWVRGWSRTTEATARPSNCDQRYHASKGGFVMGRFGSLCILLFAVLLTLLTVMACNDQDSELLVTEEPTASAPPSATASPATAVPEPTATSNLITINCDDPRFTKEILELSEDNQNPFSPRILKLYSDVEELERTERVLRCKGTATLSRGGESYITYHYEIDRDGDAFIGYEIGDPISTPTPVTMSSPGFTLDNPLSAGDVLRGSDGKTYVS